MESLRQLILHNSGYSLFPQLFLLSLSPTERNLHTRPFDPPVPTREISLVYMRHQWKREIIHAIQECILSVLPPQLHTQRQPHQEVLSIP